VVSGIGDFANRSDVLLGAAELYADGLAQGDETALDRAGDELLDAAAWDAAGPLGLYAIGQPSAAAATTEADLATVLLDLQAGNLLVAAGLQRNALPNVPADRAVFDEAHEQMAEARQELAATPSVVLGLQAVYANSADIEAARNDFRSQSKALLEEIVNEVNGTISAASEQVEKLKLADVMAAVNQIGQALPVVAQAGQLVRKGLDLIKRAIEGIFDFIGREATETVKSQLKALWEKIGQGRQNFVETLLGVAAVKARIETILMAATDLRRVDFGTNALIPVADAFTRRNTLLRAVVRGLALGGSCLALVHLAAPWVSLALGAAYLASIGAALLIGAAYTGQHRIFGDIEGVEQIAERIGSTAG